MSLAKYNEIMDKLEVSEEMHQRILHNIDCFDFSQNKKRIHFRSNKKYRSIAASFVILLVGTIAISGLLRKDMSESEHEIITTPSIQDVSSAKELSKNVGFEVEDIQSLVEVANETHYRIYGDEMAEITYTIGSESISFRKSIGSEDNSGDYNAYDIVEVIDVNGYGVTLKGEEEIYYLAVWTDEEYAYSIHSTDGLSKDQFQEYISEFR